MKSVVTVKLPSDAVIGLFDPDGPFMVIAPEPIRNGFYDDEPEVVGQFNTGETQAKFEAEWIDGEWVFGKRFFDA
jgi:hypothetical protein